jgi:hypothetical protein
MLACVQRVAYQGAGRLQPAHQFQHHMHLRVAHGALWVGRQHSWWDGNRAGLIEIAYQHMAHLEAFARLRLQQVGVLAQQGQYASTDSACAQYR